MPAPEALLDLYLQLARASEEQQQYLQRDKFLVLAANVASQAGDDDAAEAYRRAVVRKNPSHLLCRYESMEEALQHDDVVELIQSLLRTFPFEKAEYLLQKYKSGADGHGGDAPIDAGLGKLAEDLAKAGRRRTKPRSSSADVVGGRGRERAAGRRLRPQFDAVPIPTPRGFVPLGACIVFVICAFATGFGMGLFALWFRR